MHPRWPARRCASREIRRRTCLPRCADLFGEQGEPGQEGVAVREGGVGKARGLHLSQPFRRIVRTETRISGWPGPRRRRGPSAPGWRVAVRRGRAVRAVCQQHRIGTGEVAMAEGTGFRGLRRAGARRADLQDLPPDRSAPIRNRLGRERGGQGSQRPGDGFCTRKKSPHPALSPKPRDRLLLRLTRW